VSGEGWDVASFAEALHQEAGVGLSPSEAARNLRENLRALFEISADRCSTDEAGKEPK